MELKRTRTQSHVWKEVEWVDGEGARAELEIIFGLVRSRC